MFRIKKNFIIGMFLASILGMVAPLLPTPQAQAADTPDPGQCEVLSIGFGSSAGLYGIPKGTLSNLPLSNDTEIRDSIKFEALTGISTVGELRSRVNVLPTNFIVKQGSSISTPVVTVTAVLKNCFGKKLLLNIAGNPNSERTSIGIQARNDQPIYFKQLKQDETTVQFNFRAGEEGCHYEQTNIQADSLSLWFENGFNSDLVSYECVHDANIFEETSPGQWTYLPPKQDASKNILAYECINNGNIFNGPCEYDTDWQFKGCVSGCVLSDEQGNTVLGTPQAYDPNSPCYDNDKNSPTFERYREGCNELLAPLPGLTSVEKGTGIGQYINIIIRVALGILTALAVVMLIIEGLHYMTVGSITGKYDAKKKIQNIFLGLLVAFGAFTILFTINPNLLNLEPNIGDVSITDSGIQTLSASQYQGITGDTVPDDATVEAAAHKVAAIVGIPYCVYPAIFSSESGGHYGPSSIGHDENVENSSGNNIPAREDFIASGKKYSGKTFTAGDRKEKNDDNAIKPNEKGLGLDWRFSHGLGATQITFNPKYDPMDTSVNSLYKNSPKLGKVYPKDAMNLETDLTLGGELYKKYLATCGNDTRAAFDAYGDGSCDKRPDNGTGRLAAKKEATYRACVQQFGTGY